jgi:hypothetical protein
LWWQRVVSKLEFSTLTKGNEMQKIEVIAYVENEKEAEAATMGMLRGIALKMVRIEESIATFISPH